MEELKRQLLARCQRLSQAGIQMGRVSSQAEKFGPVRAVQNYLRSPCDLSLLKQVGVLEQSVEALVVQPEFGDLFSDDEVNVCFAALCAAGFYSK